MTQTIHEMSQFAMPFAVTELHVSEQTSIQTEKGKEKDFMFFFKLWIPRIEQFRAL